MPKKKIERWSARKRRAAEEARAYFERRSQTIGRPLQRRYVDTSHQLRWTLGLFLPGFLVRYPSVFDNVRLLSRHPYFKSLRITLFLWACLVIIASGVYLMYSPEHMFVLFGASLLFLVGIGLGVQIMSALWRHQTAMGALEAGVHKKVVQNYFDIQARHATRYTPAGRTHHSMTPTSVIPDLFSVFTLSVLGVCLLSLLLIIAIDWSGVLGVSFKRELPAALQMFLR